MDSKKYLAYMAVLVLLLPGAMAITCNTGTVNDNCVISSATTYTDGEVLAGSGNVTITSTGSINEITVWPARSSFIINISGHFKMQRGSSIDTTPASCPTSCDSAPSGPQGGDITIYASTIDINGTIASNGASTTGFARFGGTGAYLHFYTDEFYFNGSITASGAGGSSGSGGAGGTITVHDASLVSIKNLSFMSANGGNGNNPQCGGALGHRGNGGTINITGSVNTASGSLEAVRGTSGLCNDGIDGFNYLTGHIITADGQYNPAAALFYMNILPTQSSITTQSNQSVSTNQTVSWSVSADGDNDEVTYLFYFEEGDATPDVLVQNSTMTSYMTAITTLGQYYGKVDVFDGFGTTSGIDGWWMNFTMPSNTPPPKANITTASGQTLDSGFTLSWTPVSDAPAVNYFLYIDTFSPPTTRVLNTTGTSYSFPGEPYGAYYARVDTNDHEFTTPGDDGWTVTLVAPPTFLEEQTMDAGSSIIYVFIGFLALVGVLKWAGSEMKRRPKDSGEIMLYAGLAIVMILTTMAYGVG